MCQLLGLDACPPALKAYGHLYACDALCHLSRVDEALEQLTRCLELGEPLTPVASATGAAASMAPWCRWNSTRLPPLSRAASRPPPAASATSPLYPSSYTTMLWNFREI